MPNSKKELPQTLLGFDFGLRHIGVAFGQSVTKTASPVTTLAATDGIPKWPEISELIAKWKPEGLVVGVAFNEDGSSQPITFSSRKFMNRLRTRYKLPVFEVDERLSSWEARERIQNLPHRTLQDKKRVHAVAAVVLVEQWMLENL